MGNHRPNRNTALFALIALLTCAWATAAAQRLALSCGSVSGGVATWKLTNANGTLSLPATVPGYALEILRAAGIVQDPLYRFGELESRWVALDTWTFSAAWQGAAHAALAASKAVVLLLGGVDAAAGVSLNGRELGEVDNAHRGWSFPVKGLLLEGDNLLQVAVRPAVGEALRLKRAYPYSVPTLAAPGAWDVYNFLRKPASDFGWDWGPAFAAAGVHGHVELIGFDRALLTGAHVSVQLSADGSQWVVQVEASLVVPPGGDAGTLTAALPGVGVAAEEQVRLEPPAAASTAASADDPFEAAARLTLSVPAGAVDRWWPVGMGGQPLYNLEVTFSPDGEDCTTDGATDVSGEAGEAGAAGAAVRREGAGGGPVPGGGGPGGDGGAAGTCAAAKEGGRGGGGGSGSKGGAGAGGVGGGDGRRCGRVMRRIGFRSVELVTDPLPEAARDLMPREPQSGAGAEDGAGDSARAGKGGWCLSPDGRWLNARGPGARAAWWHPSEAPDRSWPRPPGSEDFDASEARGTAFYFRVNGIPVYAKGANLIPLNVLPTNVTGRDLRRLMEDALAANMNMVRIWGGGVYPGDALYDYADEHGIMVWQETAFACSPYPRDPAFLANVEEEVRQQVRRLNWHASVVIWGGNNEVEASLEWYDDTRSNAALYAVDYDKLFVGTIGVVVQQLAPSTPFVDGSPSNGLVSPRLQVKRWSNPQDPSHGDVHFYDYKTDCQDWRHYPRARFVSEYGWQSYPTWLTYSAATSPEDWTLGAEMHEFRQRHPNGTRELLAQLARRFQLPHGWLQILTGAGAGTAGAETGGGGGAASVSGGGTDGASVGGGGGGGGVLSGDGADGGGAARELRSWGTGDGAGGKLIKEVAEEAGGRRGARRRPEEYESWVYLTQVQQMLCYDTAIGLWRRLRSDPRALTMGVLYWQLNDVWAGASWSSVDHGGRWKPLHYGVRRLFAPLALSAAEGDRDGDGSTLEVFVINDHPDPVDLTLRIMVHSIAPPPSSPSEQRAPASGHRGGGAGAAHCGRRAEAYATSPGAADGGGGAPGRFAATAPGASATRAYRERVDTLLALLPGCSRETCLVRVTAAPSRTQPGAGDAAGAAVGDHGGRRRHHRYHPAADAESTVWLAPFKDMPLRDPQVEASGFSAVPGRRDAVRFAVTARHVAPMAVWEAPKELRGSFSDNAVTLVPCEPREVVFYGTGGAEVDVGRLEAGLRISSLWDHQQFDRHKK